MLGVTRSVFFMTLCVLTIMKHTTTVLPVYTV